MKTGWHEVARLGETGNRYPHLLADAHGWCLRLGPDRKKDERYYSRLTNVLEGLVEQGVRRNLAGSASAAGVVELTLAVRSVLTRMLRIGRRLELRAQESPVRPANASDPSIATRTSSTSLPASRTALSA